MEYPAYPSGENPRTSPSILGIPVEVAFAIFALLVAANLAYLDVLIIQLLNKTGQTASSVSVQSTFAASRSDMSCPQSCLVKIQSLATQSAQSVIATRTPQQIETPARTAVSTVKEFFVPIGSGSSTATDWADGAGLAATIDTTNYSKIKSVVFEATIRIPTGNEVAYARLFNVTDQHPVWFSDVSVEGGVAKLAVSPAITLDTGNKTYQVQLKTSLGSEMFIDQARIHIVTY